MKNQEFMGLPKFHTVHGSGVTLTNNKTVAQKLNVSTVDGENGIVFSDRPIQINEKVYIKILTSHFYANVKLGFAERDPKSLSKTFFKQASDELTMVSGYWIQKYAHMEFRENSLLAYSVNELGEVTLEISGEPKGLLFTMDINGPLWALFDLDGHSTAIQILGPNNNSTRFQTFYQESMDRLAWKTEKNREAQRAMQMSPRSPSGQDSKQYSRPAQSRPSSLFSSFSTIKSYIPRRVFEFLDERPKTPANVRFVPNRTPVPPRSPMAIQNSGHVFQVEKREEEEMHKQKNCALTILNVPLDTVNHFDIRQKFDSVHAIEVIKSNGTVKIFFKTDEDALKAFTKSDMLVLGEMKLGWIRPEELFVEDVPKNVTGAEIRKEFERGKRIKFLNGEGGKRIASVMFTSQLEQKKAYENSQMVQLGIQRLSWVKETGGGKGAQLRVTNLGLGLTKEEIKERFPDAFQIKVEGVSGAIIHYKTREEAETAYENSDLLKLGNKTLGWLLPYELYIQDIPRNVKDGDLRKYFPTTKNITWQQQVEKSGKRIATVEFVNENVQKKAYNGSNFQKVSRQILSFDGGNITLRGTSSDTSLTEAELSEVKKVWELPEIGYSNISNLFTPAIIISGFPSSITRLTLRKHFPNAKKIEIEEMAGRGPVAQVEFDSPEQAAHAYGVSRRRLLEGHQLTVKPVRAGGSQRRRIPETE